MLICRPDALEQEGRYRRLERGIVGTVGYVIEPTVGILALGAGKALPRFAKIGPGLLVLAHSLTTVIDILTPRLAGSP